MDFSKISDEELLKPDAQASAPDFSQMRDEELLKPDRPNTARPSNLEQMSDEELLKPDAPDFSKMSDEELLKPDAAQEPEKKDIGIGGWMKAELAAKQGREVSGWDVAKNKLSLGIDDANENRKAYVEQRLAMMEEDNPIEMIKLAQSIGLDQAKIDEIMERADSGQRSAFGLKLNPKIDVMKQGFSELAKPLMEARLKAREAAQQTMAEAKELGAVGKIVKGAADMGPTVAAYMNPVTAGIQTAGGIVNRLDNLQKDVYKLDENGNPVLVQAGDRSEAAAFKAVGGGYAEYLIWGVGVRKMLGIGGDALKSIPGIGKYFAAAENAVKGTVGKAASPITEKAAAAWKATTQKLGESAGGRVLLKTGELLGKIDDNLKVGSLPHMVVKSRLTEYLDEVVGLNARDGERESLGEWLDKVTSIENNADMLLGMIAVHVGMAALSAHGRVKTQKEYNKALDKFKERVKAAYGEEKAKQFSDEDYRRIFKIVNSPNLTPESMTKLIDRITGEIDAQVADAKGRARMREEETEDTSAIKSGNGEAGNGNGEAGNGNGEAGNGNAGEAERSSTIKSKALDLLGKMDEGSVPVEDVAIGDVEGLEPSDTGKAIENYDPAKAKPIVVWEDLEGNRHAVTGGKRLAMAGASGAETVKAVVVKEADGWTEAEARSLGTTENLREGSGTLKNVVEAVDSIGADGVAELAGWHQANGSREFASMMRKGLAVAQKGGAELRAALAEGRIGEDFAYNAAQVLSMERVGEGWEAAQRELAGLVGKVGPEELEAVLWGLKRQLAEGTSAIKSGDFAAAIAEERAKYNARKGGGEGKLDSDQVLIETADGELKTLGEIESGMAEDTSAVKSGEGEAMTAEAPELAAAEGAGANKAVELRPIQGRDGAFGTLSHPNARFTVDGERKIVAVEGLTPEDFAPGRAEATAALVARIEAYAVDNGLRIGFRDEATRDAWARMRENIKAEGKEAYSRKQMEERRNTVVDRLTKSGLATEVVQTKGDFDRLVVELNGRPLTAGEQVYGFCDVATGKVYLNPDFFATRQGLDAPIHEFGHLGIIAAEKVNKAVYDRGMKLAEELLGSGTDGASGGPAPGPKTGVAEIVDFILNDEYYSKRSRQEQAEELLAQLIGKRGEAALRAETNKTVANKIKAWLVEFWNTFGKALGLKDITPEEAAKMTVEQVADAIRAEMMSGRKYGEGLDRVEFGDGGARIVTKPTRIKRKLTGRRKAVNEFVNRMGGEEDPANVETDLLALWVDNGGRLFDAMPFQIETNYSSGKTGVKATRRAVADEFAESTAFYQDLDPAQRKVFFGSEKLEMGPIGEGLKNKLKEAGITRFTNEDGTVDFDAVIDEFKRQWTNYERGEEVLKERNEWQEERDRAYVEEMERAEQAAYDEMNAEEAAARAEMEAADEASAAQIAADLAAGRFSRGGIFTGTAADYANRSREGGKDDGPSLLKIGTGEGSQVYGWGLYGSTVRGVAETYMANSVRDPRAMARNFLEINKTKDAAIKAIKQGMKQRGLDDELKKTARKAIKILQSGKSIPDTIGNLYEQTFFTDRAPGDESHLLKWYETVEGDQKKWVQDELQKENLVTPEAWGAPRADGAFYNYTGPTISFSSGDSLYRSLSKLLGTPQAASEFLARAGIDGVKYPVDSYGGKGVKDGDEVGWNYVSFRDDNIRVDHKWTDGQLRFSRFAGEKGAENMGVGNANHARSMESAGADREKIWRETGWWKGKDGKWRFELPSAKMKGEKEVEAALRINDRGSSETTLEKLLDAPELFRAYPQLKDTKITLSPEHNDEAGGWYDVRNNEIVLFDTGLKSLKHLPFRERDLRDTYQKVIDSDEYIRQRFENMDALGIEHGTAEEEREYAKKWIERQDRNIRSANETMIRDLVKDRSAYGVFAKIVHEVQHAVQYLEGFAKGGNPELAAAFVKNLKRKQRIWLYKLTVEETARELGTTNPYEIEKAILRTLGASSREQVAGLEAEGWIPDKAGRDKGYNLFARGYDKEGYEEAYDKYLGEMNKSGMASWWNGSPHELYSRLAGEVEARNASRREEMTPEERAATPPWATEDVPESRQIVRFSRAVKPSALGDGNQRYYEVPFDKAVDKIVKAKKPVSRDHVFVGETPKPFADIGFARLPVMMGQRHVISCYFGEGEGVEGKHLHKMKGNLKLLPKALEKPLMIITSESSPSDSVVAILKMKDNTGASVIVPVKMSGVGRAGAEKLDAHIALTMFGKKNAWKSLVANAIEKETNGEVGVFYIDGAESKTILERLGDKAKGLGVAGLQSPGETKAHANPKLASAGLKYAKKPQGNGTLHSIADADSPVKGQAGIVKSQTATRQFKNWFGKGKFVDANGEPLVLYHETGNDFTVFDPRHDGAGARDYETPFGIFMKPSRDPIGVARGGNRRQMALYANVQNPVHFNSRHELDQYLRKNCKGYSEAVDAIKNIDADYGKRLEAAEKVEDEAMKDIYRNHPEIWNDDARRMEMVDKYAAEPKRILDEWKGAADKQSAALKEITDRFFRDSGHDGVVIENDAGSFGRRTKTYIALNPEQVKSATDNIGTFDPGNNDIRFSRDGKPPEAELVQTTRVADDAGVGEQTPGAIAASRELSRQGAVPVMTKGTRYVSLPLSEMRVLNKYLTGHAMPDEMQSGRKIGAPGKASTKNRKLMIAADVLGTVDKSDMAAEKATLQQHGFFRNEDAQWAANHTKSEIRQERERSDAALSSRLEALSDRRVHGKEPGGQMAATRVYADQLAKIVMAMPHGQPGVLGAMQTVAGALEKRVRGSEAEAEAFLNWMSGQPQASGQAPRSAQERKVEMFAAFLMMPKEMEARAKGWYDGIRSTIAGDKKLAEAFRKMTVRMMSEQAYGHLQAEIMRAQDAQTEAAIKKLNAEANEPIAAGDMRARATEAVVLSCDDRMGAAIVRVDAATRNYLAAQKLLMKQAKTPADRAAIKQQTDRFIGEIAQAKNQVELSRTAWERGHNNVDARYLWRVVDILNEATVRDGLKMSDISLYLDQQRVIETKGLSGSRGESARQAQIILDAMKKRLGGDYAKIEAFARKFHAIHEQELLNDPALKRVLGKGTVEYWKSQTHYVTTKRQHSPEELAEIEAARRLVGASGKFGGDTVVGQMYKYCTRPDATAKLKGSFADKQEVMSATLEKVAAIKKWVRRNDYVIELRDLLVKANVEGVHDFAAGKNEFPNNRRYGSISYMENGQKRTLVVPREIADGFKAQSMYDNAALKLCAGVNNIARQLWIDWNPVYWQRNIARNAGSIEMNMPGMREAKIKRAIRFAFPGLAPVTEIAMTHLVRHMPEKWSMPLRKVWGEHTALFYAPKAKRMAMWLTDHNEMQRRLWDAERRGDLGAIQEMEEDRRDMLAALRANMLVGISAGKASGTSGFLDDSVKTVGKTMQREIQDAAKKATWRKTLETANIFSKNAKQQVFEDVMAKFSAYLHDRAQFGKGNNRTAEESGLMVKKNVSIGEGERKGGAAGTVQAVFQPFWNMVEKGVVRNVKAYGERTGETMEKAAWRLAPMILHGLIGSGAVAAWILRANDDDEEKAKNGKLGEVYRYLRDAQRAYQNCSNYVRNNYHVTPLMTDGYTSIILGMPLTDEERLLKPVARFVTDAASVASGTKESMDLAGFMSDATGTIAPDFKIAGALPTLLDDTVHALMENPTDYYTGGQKYDKDLHALRNESWGMRGRFLAAMGKRLWNDFGGRNVLPVDRAGVDNGLGRAPGWVAKMVNDIPIASPILRSFVKVQVGSPKRDAAEISEAEARRRAIGRICAKDMFEKARREKRDLSLDPVRYGEMLDKWQQAYGLTPDDMAQIEARYLNAWRAYEGAQFKADGEREKFRSKAEKLGLDAARIWLDWD